MICQYISLNFNKWDFKSQIGIFYLIVIYTEKASLAKAIAVALKSGVRICTPKGANNRTL